MDLSTIFLIWILIAIIDNILKRRKRKFPSPQDKKDTPNFDIPTIAGDPNLPGEEVPIILESPTQAEVRPKKNPPRQKKISEPMRNAENPDELNLNLTPSTVMNAFVIAEILDKPKALRRRRF